MIFIAEPVLILGGEPRIVVTIARSLHYRGIPVYLASTSREEPKIHSQAIQESINLPNPHDGSDKFIKAMVDLIDYRRTDMLIPTTDSALVVVKEYYKELSPLLHLSCPAPHILERALDKSLTLKIAEQCGIPTPVSYSVRKKEDLETLRNTFEFPIIAKPRNKAKSGNFKMRYFQSFCDLKQSFELDPQFGEHNLLQNYYFGEGVGIETLMHNGEPVAVFQHRRLKEFPSRGGVSVLAVSEPPDPELEEQAITLLRHLEWEGIAMVEFRRNKNNKQSVLMEINGRSYGSLSLSIQAGIDFPYYAWQLAHHESPKPPTRYRAGLRWRWTNGEVMRLHDLLAGSNGTLSRQSLCKELFGFLNDLLPPTKDALWQWNDPLPFLFELYSSIKKLIIEDAKIFIKKLIPTRMIHQIRIYRNLDKQDRAMFVKLQMLRALRLRIDRPQNIPSNILFVCHGNIVRSPMAAELLRKHLDESCHNNIAIVSAGLYAKPGRGADTRAIVVAKEFGISLESHRVQQLTKELIDRADLIFVMDFLNETKLLATYPHAKHKTVMLGGFGLKTNTNPIEIPDPYNSDVSSIR